MIVEVYEKIKENRRLGQGEEGDFLFQFAQKKNKKIVWVYKNKKRADYLKIFS